MSGGVLKWVLCDGARYLKTLEFQHRQIRLPFLSPAELF